MRGAAAAAKIRQVIEFARMSSGRCGLFAVLAARALLTQLADAGRRHQPASRPKVGRARADPI